MSDPEVEPITAEEEEEEVEEGKGTTSPPMDKETRDQYIGTKIAKHFNGVPYLGEVTSTRNSQGTDLFKIKYRDGDVEDMLLKEVQVANTLYESLQIKMWDYAITLVGLDEQEVEKLKSEGIDSIVKLELFGGNSDTNGNPFAGLGLPLIKQQELRVVATFLLNNGILTSESRLEELARINLELSRAPIAPTAAAVATAAAKPPGRPRGRPPKKASTNKPKSAGRPRGRPRKESAAPAGRPRGRPKGNKSMDKTPVAKAAKKPRPPPKERSVAAAKPKEIYNGPVPAEDTLIGVPDWPHAGWSKISYQRANNPSQSDNFWITPGGHKLRSSVEVRKFVKALADTNGDEAVAVKEYKSVNLKE